MTVAQLKLAHHAVPFIPFSIHYPGGQPVEVPHPDFLIFSATGRIARVSLLDEWQIRIDVALITALEDLVVIPE